MELFTKLFGDFLAFVYHCFDRIVIHGYVTRLCRPEHVVYFFREVVGVPVITKVIAHPDGCTAGLWASGVAASGKPFSVERIASSAAMPCRRAVSITERMSA